VFHRIDRNRRDVNAGVDGRAGAMIAAGSLRKPG
jgi:hypothetical protein